MLSLRTITLPMYDNSGKPLQAESEAFANTLISVAGGFTVSEQWGEWRDGPGSPINSEAVRVYTVGMSPSAAFAAQAWGVILAAAWKLYPDQKTLFVTGPGGAELLNRPWQLKTERVFDAMDGETHREGEDGDADPRMALATGYTATVAPHHTTLHDYDADALEEERQALEEGRRPTTLDDIKAILPPRQCPTCGAPRYSLLAHDAPAHRAKVRWDPKAVAEAAALKPMDNLYETGNPTATALDVAGVAKPAFGKRLWHARLLEALKHGEP